MYHGLTGASERNTPPNATLVESGRELSLVAGGNIEQTEKSVRDYEMISVSAKESNDGDMVVVEEDTIMKDALVIALERGERLRCNGAVGHVILGVEPGSESFLTRVKFEDD